ncbi:MAG: zinc-dependent alcohol dehydrogenase [Mahellales bacterium]
MKALIKTKSGVGNVGIKEIPEPKCPDNELKVEIKYAGLCGTDLHVYNDTFRNYPPVILGHELSGIIVEKGKQVRGFEVGDRVALLGSNRIICKTCEFCRKGYYMFCPDRRGMGHGTNGGFTKFVCVREDMAFKIPDSMTLEEAAILEAFASSVQAVEEVACLNSGDCVLISGPGPIGLMCMILTLKRGLKTYITGVSQDKERLEVVRKLGGVPIDVQKEDLGKRIMEDTKGRGVDVVFECSGVPSAITTALDLVRPMGSFIQLGLGATSVNLNMERIVHKRITIMGSVGHSMNTWDIMMRMIRNTGIDLKPIISHRMPLSQWQEAFELMKNKKALKIVMYYDF